MSQSTYRPFVRALYPMGPLLALASVADPIIRIVPFKPGNLAWRFGAVGLISDGMVGFLFGVICTIGIAAILDDRRTARVLAALTGLGGIVLAAVLAFFLLDALQVRSGVQAQLKPAFDISVAKAAFMIGISSPIALLVGIAGWRSTPRPQGAAATARPAPAVLLNRKTKEVVPADPQVAH